MIQIKQYLLVIISACLMALPVANAQESKPNSIESMNVLQQGSVLSVKLTFKDPLAALPAGFTVAQPARVALDFPNTVNGLGKSSQEYNEGDLRSANIVQVEGRTRLVFNLKQAMTYEATIEGNTLLLAFSQTGKVDSTVGQPAAFAEARASKVSNSIRNVEFRRGKDGEARITVDLSDSNAGIDIRQQGQNLVVDFVKVSLPDNLRKRLDVTDFATPVTTVNTMQQGANTRMTITPKGLWEHNAYQTDNQFVIEVKQVIENPNKLVQARGAAIRERSCH